MAGKIVITEKISSIKKLQEIKNQAASLRSQEKEITEEMKEISEMIRELKEVEKKIIDAKKTMYVLLKERLENGLAKNVAHYAAALQRELEDLGGEAAAKAKGKDGEKKEGDKK